MASDNTWCTFEINGKTLTFDGKANTRTPYKMTLIEGLSASDYEVNVVSSGEGHGGRVSGKRVKEREITIEGEYRGAEDVDDQEDMLIGFFTPLSSGKLTVNKGGRQRYINFELSSFQVKRENYYHRLGFQIILLCPDPFFKSIDAFSQNMASRIPLVRAAFFIPPSGHVSSIKRFTQEAHILNNGHKPTGLNIEMIAGGDVENPKLTNLTTGEYIRINVTLKKGDVLLVNTVQGETDITLNGEKITHLKDRGSRYFQMVVGDNILRYDADRGYVNLNVYPRYREEWLGI